jgi:hypothetical protein
MLYTDVPRPERDGVVLVRLNEEDRIQLRSAVEERLEHADSDERQCLEGGEHLGDGSHARILVAHPAVRIHSCERMNRSVYDLT